MNKQEISAEALRKKTYYPKPKQEIIDELEASDAAIIDGICRIANAEYKKKGYLLSIPKDNVRTILRVVMLLSNATKESQNGTANKT